MRRPGGYFSLYLSATLFACVALFVGFASRRYGGVFVSAARFAIGAALCLLILGFGYRDLRPKRPGLLALRGLFGAASMAGAYVAISLSGPGRATLLGNTYPLFVAVFGALFFGERFRARTLASIGICLAGAVLVARDGSGTRLAGDLIALASAVSAGVAINFVRLASARDNPFMIYLSPCLFGLPIFFFLPPGTNAAAGGWEGVALLFAVGALSLLAQALMTHGYRTVSAGAGSVVFYWETVLSVALGVLFAGERLNARFLAGLAAILVGLRLNQKRDKASGVSSPA